LGKQQVTRVLEKSSLSLLMTRTVTLLKNAVAKPIFTATIHAVRCDHDLQVKRVNKTTEKGAKRSSDAPGKLAEIRARLALKTWQRSVLVLGLAVVAFAWLAWVCRHDPKINFLPRDARAEWILFPRAVDATAHPVASLDTVFRRQFELGDQPRAARLNMRAGKRAELKINGAPVEIAASGNWKDVVSVEVTAFLRTGTNSIEVRVFNDNAPAALWLTLTADRFTLRSDGNWEASCTDSAWRRVALAATPRFPGPGNPVGGGEETFRAVGVIWPMWLMFAGIALAICVGSRWIGRWLKPAASGGLSRRQSTMLLLILGSLWGLLFWNNAGLMPFLHGFDSQYHLDYIKYVQERRALPLPTEGFEMFQPPLYYVVSAVALSLGGLSVDTQSGILALRFLTLLFSLLQFILVFLSVRLCFPGRTTAQLVGLVLAAFLPMQLYLSHYVTNETLAATLATASIYLGLRLFRTKDPSVSQFAWLGLCMGAALLTKATALLVVLPLFLAVIVNLIAERAPVALWLRHFGTLCAVVAVACGWHYVRIWHQFGTPVVGNWDVAAGFAWWQDAGFHTASDYARFGRSLVSPLFSGFGSFADGIYSTLWGDGLCGGVADLAYRPPWNYKLMVAGYVLALAPALLILVGAAVACWRFVRKPSLDFFVLAGSSGAVIVGVVFMTLKVASYAQVKAFYGLALLVPLCFFGAVGWELVTRGRRLLQGALGVLLLVWAMNSFASFWIIRSASQHAYMGIKLGAARKLDAALVEAMKAVESNPADAVARRFSALILNELGRTSESLPYAQRAVELSPLDSAAHLELAVALAGPGETEAALGEARRALELGPENSAAWDFSLFCLSKLRRTDEAINVARDGLAVFPYRGELHHALGLALMQKQDFVAAANHFGYALLLRPDLVDARANFRLALRQIGNASDGLKRLQEVALFAPDAPAILNEIAWFFATQPEATLRNGSEAVRLAEHACALTGRTAPEMLATLAAAYAESGKVSEAIKVAEEARARSSGNPEMLKLTEKLLAAFQADHAYHEN
jgi:Flp pilus assembly protein TadD